MDGFVKLKNGQMLQIRDNYNSDTDEIVGKGYDCTNTEVREYLICKKINKRVRYFIYNNSVKRFDDNENINLYIDILKENDYLSLEEWYYLIQIEVFKSGKNTKIRKKSKKEIIS